MSSYSTDVLTAINYIKNGVTTSLKEVIYGTTKVWSKLTSVTISGTEEPGNTLTASVGADDATPMSWQWYRGSTAISGATANTYAITSDDWGNTLFCRATAYGGREVDSPNTGIIKIAITGVTLSGTAQEGSTLTATVSPSGATVSYQWYRGSTAISGATSSTYTCVNADGGYKLHCTVTGTGNYSGSATSPNSATVKKFVLKTGTLCSWTGYVGRFNTTTSNPQTNGIYDTYNQCIGGYADIPSGKYPAVVTVTGTAHKYDSDAQSITATAYINYGGTWRNVWSQNQSVPSGGSKTWNSGNIDVWSTWGATSCTQMKIQLNAAPRNAANQDQWVIKITQWYVLE